MCGYFVGVRSSVSAMARPPVLHLNSLHPPQDFLDRDQIPPPRAGADFGRPLPRLGRLNVRAPERPRPALGRADRVDRTAAVLVPEDAVVVRLLPQADLAPGLAGIKLCEFSERFA